MARLILCTLFLHVLDTVQVYGVTDVSAHFGGKAGAEYTETTDSQSKALEGTEDSLSIRNLDTFSFVDLGLNIGTLKLSDDTGNHDVDFQANYAKFGKWKLDQPEGLPVAASIYKYGFKQFIGYLYEISYCSSLPH